MPSVENLDNIPSPSANPQRNSPLSDAPQPSIAKVLLCIGFVGVVFIGLLGTIIIVGVSAFHTSLAENAAEEARQLAAEMAKYSHFEPFKPGDPIPEPPLDLMPPATPSSKLGRYDLADFDGRQLADEAYRRYSQRKDYRTAIQCQFQSVIKLRTGYYNLACFYARAGDLPAAFFWLQVSAREEMANAEWALQDEDLVEVRKDPRWPIVLNYIKAWQWKWAQSDRSETTLILPRNATASEPLPVFIGLHNLNFNAHGMIDTMTYQRFADEMGVAFLGVSGTICLGKESFAWSDDSEKNLARIDAALAEVADKLTPAEGKQVLFGFRQGATIAAELAAQQPSRFAGAILLSPGADSEGQAVPLQVRTGSHRQGIVAVCSTGESLETIERTSQYAETFKTSGARVLLKDYPGMKTSYPPDFVVRFPTWGRFVLNPDAPVPFGGQ